MNNEFLHWYVAFIIPIVHATTQAMLFEQLPKDIKLEIIQYAINGSSSYSALKEVAHACSLTNKDFNALVKDERIQSAILQWCDALVANKNKDDFEVEKCLGQRLVTHRSKRETALWFNVYPWLVDYFTKNPDKIENTLHHPGFPYPDRPIIKWMLRELMKCNDIDKQYIYGKTLLHYSAKFNSIEVAADLLARGADVHITDELGNTAYHTAHINNYAEICALIEKYDESEHTNKKVKHKSKKLRIH